MSTLLTAARPALSDLTEQERMFQEAVRDFAQAEIAPKVMEMDQAQQMDPSLLPQLFEMGLMGVEIPEQFESTGADFFTSILIVEELSRVDPPVCIASRAEAGCTRERYSSGLLLMSSLSVTGSWASTSRGSAPPFSRPR